jgi:hypothetical protein
MQPPVTTSPRDGRAAIQSCPAGINDGGDPKSIPSTAEITKADLKKLANRNGVEIAGVDAA